MPITEADKQFVRLSRVSIRYFILKMWKLVAQPVRPEYAEFVKTAKEKDIRNDMFQPFVKGKHYTWQQNLLFEDVEAAVQSRGPRRISIVSGHGTGKSSALAMIIIWYLFCWIDAQVPCTAPTSEQMHDILWKELSLWLGRLPEKIKALFDWQTGYVRMVERPETWFARAKTARKENPEALAGVHGDHVLMAIDEGSAVPDEIFNTAEGALTGPSVLVIMISNGTRLIGYFYNSHHNDKANWKNRNFNSEESPIVDKSFVERIIQRHGKESDEYTIRVKGGFGKEDGVDNKGYVPLMLRGDFQIVPNDQISFGNRKRMGVDPAGEGSNKTKIWIRDAFQCKCVFSEQISKPKQIAQKVLQLAVDYDIDFSDIWVDNFGEGANVAQEVALQGTTDSVQARINAVNVGDNAEDPEHYLNIRAEASWRMKQWFKAGGVAGYTSEVEEQALSLRYHRMTGKGSRIQMMSKDMMRKEGYESPDDTDAIMLTFVEEDSFETPKPKVRKEHKPQTEYGG